MDKSLFSTISHDNDIIFPAHSTSLLVISSALGELTMPLLVGQVSDIQEDGKISLKKNFPWKSK